jgi:hypothetical protein
VNDDEGDDEDAVQFSEREIERARRARARIPENDVPPRAVFLAIAAVFFVGLILGFVLGRAT